ncbi:hypothetical protein Pmani_013523 [Petrolisthes manimaculis]|uniref:Serine aminopeptidase S33 domain-containing protein n=1 Tax=Petrolisthes manimaculis TaxID=1843537 RepID=A0AAE1PY65_9EUCA|nr:hypothetical protein Pmani_013523 [Petrolisthes manimaculis]
MTGDPILRPRRRFHVSATEPDTHYHKIVDQTSGQTRELAYKKTQGPQKYGLVYVPGFMAHKAGGKALDIHTYAQDKGFSYVRYDPSGLGESRGVKPMHSDFSLWVEDASQILQHVTEGPQIIVASSMGCWVTCLLASQFPDKIAGVVFLAPALNFHTRYEATLLSQLPPQARQSYEEGGTVKLFVPDVGDIPLTRAMIRALGKYALPLDEEDAVPLDCPVRIIYGMNDDRVPHTEPLSLLKCLRSRDVHLTYLKDAGHTLMEPHSLAVIRNTILTLNKHILG